MRCRPRMARSTRPTRYRAACSAVGGRVSAADEQTQALVIGAWVGALGERRQSDGSQDRATGAIHHRYDHLHVARNIADDPVDPWATGRDAHKVPGVCRLHRLERTWTSRRQPAVSNRSLFLLPIPLLEPALLQCSVSRGGCRGKLGALPWRGGRRAWIRRGPRWRAGTAGPAFSGGGEVVAVEFEEGVGRREQPPLRPHG